LSLHRYYPKTRKSEYHSLGSVRVSAVGKFNVLIFDLTTNKFVDSCC